MLGRRVLRRPVVRGSSVAAIDPAALSLTGWWRASYAGSPWAGTASAGGSGSRNLTEATNPPGTAVVGGFTAADADGTNDVLNYTGTLDDLINANAASMWVLFNADTAQADAGAGNRINNTAFLAEGSAGFFSFGFTAGGVHVSWHNAGAYSELIIACATAGWHLAQFKYDAGQAGAQLRLRVDGGAWSTASAGVLDGGLTNAVKLLQRYFLGNFFDGKILDIGTADSALSDASFDGIRGYCNTRYAVSV